MIKNLRTLRTQKGVSQLQLANALGVSQQSINKYENHNVEPDIATLIAMASYFHTSVDYLIGATDYAEPIRRAKPHELDEEEQAIIDGYRRLSDTEQLCVRTIISTFRSNSK